MYDVHHFTSWCTLMYINFIMIQWCTLMYINVWCMMHINVHWCTLMYIIHDDVRWCTSFSTSWCTVVQHHGTSWCMMHIIYDVKLCTSSSNMIQNDVHQVTSYVMYITNTYDVSWCAMIWHRFFFQIFFLRSSIPASFFFSESLPRVGRTTTLHFIISTTLLFSLIWALVTSTHN